MAEVDQPIFAEVPDGLDETWTHGILVGGMASESDEVSLARQYRDAAALLVDAALKDGEPWSLSYPILFLYRHSTELYLKAIVWRLDAPDSRPNHELSTLFDRFEKLVIERHGKHVPSWVKRDILGFAQLDDNSQQFRYTRSTKNVQFMLPGEYWVELRRLQRRMEAISRGLESILWS
jgi:hypothetical protein